MSSLTKARQRANGDAAQQQGLVWLHSADKLAAKNDEGRILQPH